MLALGLVVAISLAAGLPLRARVAPRAAYAGGWLLAVGGVLLALVLAREEPATWRFLAISGALFFALKVISHASWRLSGAAPLPLLAWLLFATSWIGMHPAPFAPAARRPRRRAGALLFRGLVGLQVGGLCWLGLAHLWQGGAPAAWVHAGQLLAVYGTMRWGAFPAVAGVLRWRGVLVGPPFRAPERAASLMDFWSRRWNRPFSEMLQLIVERPLRGRRGRRAAGIAAFVISGLLHEASVSLPVGAGFGLPTLYFLLQLGLVGLERRTGVPAGFGRLARRAWVLGWAALPAVLVFHPPFLAGVLAPLLGPRG